MHICALVPLTTMLLAAPALAGPEIRGTGDFIEPDVIMEADPPPPFTYWAPEGSTVKNHPREVGIWIAEGQEVYPTSYFGDLCKASEFQQFLGKEVSHFPPKPEDAIWRFVCSECPMHSDLNFRRMNVMFEQQTSVVTSVSCS